MRQVAVEEKPNAPAPFKTHPSGNLVHSRNATFKGLRSVVARRCAIPNSALLNGWEALEGKGVREQWGSSEIAVATSPLHRPKAPPWLPTSSSQPPSGNASFH